MGPALGHKLVDRHRGSLGIVVAVATSMGRTPDGIWSAKCNLGVGN